MNTVLSFPYRYTRVLAIALGILTAPMAVTASNANPPNGMTYQGYLVDATGTPLASTSPANYDTVFRIYSASTGGTSLWSEKQTVTVDNGQFSVVLGEGGAVTGEPHGLISTVFAASDASDRYVGITVTIGTSSLEIAPRLKFLASPYSYLAQNAGGLVNPDGSSVQLAKLNSDQTLSGANTFSGDANFNATAIFSGAADFIGNVGFNNSATFTNGLVASSVTTSNAIVNGNVTVSGTVTAGTFVGSVGGTIPVGGIIMWSGTLASIPTNWAFCNGTQGTPNLTGRFVLGTVTGGDIGGYGGNSTTSLSTANLPAHSHQYGDYQFQAGGSSDYSGAYYTWGTSGIGFYGAFGSLGHATYANSTTGNTGSGTPFSIMPPFYILAYIMRLR